MAFSLKAGEKKLETKAANKGATDFVAVYYFDGLGITRGSYTEIYLLSDRLLLQISNLQTNNVQNFEIKLSQIRSAEYKSERQLAKEGKNAMGYPIVGGISGIGTKQKNELGNNYLIINYSDSQGELKRIAFNNPPKVIKTMKFCNKINSSLPSAVSGTPIQL
jgi:hypothetical protein